MGRSGKGSECERTDASRAQGELYGMYSAGLQWESALPYVMHGSAQSTAQATGRKGGEGRA
jgi:hypothetical protein